MLGAAADAHVELAGQAGEGTIPQEKPGELLDDGRRIQQLSRCESRDRAADDVADVVHPGLQRHEADPVEAPPDFFRVFEGEAADLQLLPRRDVHPSVAELLAEARDGLDLLGAGASVRDTDAHHETPGCLTAEEHARPLQALPVVVADRLPAGARQGRHVVHDLEAVPLALDPLDPVQRDDDIARGGWRACDIGRLGRRLEDRGIGHPRSGERDDALHFGPARSAAGGCARQLAHRLDTRRAAKHRFDDLRFAHGIAVADLRGVRQLIRGHGRRSTGRWGTEDGIGAPLRDRGAFRERLHQRRHDVGVAQHDGARQAVLPDDQLLVDPLRGLRITYDLVIVVGPIVEPHDREIDAGHFELRGRA